MALQRGFALPAGACAVLIALMLAACSGESGRSEDSGSTGTPTEPDGRVTEVSPPTSVDATLTDDDQPQLEISFEPSAEADAYLVMAHDDPSPIRVERDECTDGQCTVTLDRLSVAGAESVAVMAIVGSTVSPLSEPVALPNWPARTQPTMPTEDEPVELVVIRRSDDGSLAVETETVAPDDDLAGRIAELRESDDVVTVAPNVSITADSTDVDPSLDEEPDGLVTWQADALKFDVLPESRGEGVQVAIIDHAPQASHPSLRDAAITTTNVVDRSAYVPDTHGTAISSMIVGQPAGTVPGIAPQATVRVYDVFNGGVGATLDSVAKGVIEAVQDGADVINMSLSVSCTEWLLSDVLPACPDDALKPAIELAEERGVVVVAAAGNDGGLSCVEEGEEPSKDRWPAKFPTTIAVGSATRSGSPALCSPEKAYVNTMAPGEKIRIADVGDGYAVRSGTSIAAPLVAGLIAAVLAERPDLTPEQIRSLISQASEPTGRVDTEKLLSLLDLYDDPSDDTPDDANVVPFSLRMSLDDDHPAQQITQALRSHPVISDVPKPGLPRDDVQVDGYLRIGDDGQVTGTAKLQRTAPAKRVERGEGPFTRTRKLTAHRVECPPRRDLTFPAMLEFDWEIDAAVAGRVDTSNDDAHRLDLTVSLGDGATPEQPGARPAMSIYEDGLDVCEDLLTGDAPPLYESLYYKTWNDVELRRDRLVAELENYYDELIDSGPFTISASYSPAELGDEPREVGRAAGDAMTLQLTLGGHRPYEEFEEDIPEPSMMLSRIGVQTIDGSGERGGANLGVPHPASTIADTLTGVLGEPAYEAAAAEHAPECTDVVDDYLVWGSAGGPEFAVALQNRDDGQALVGYRLYQPSERIFPNDFASVGAPRSELPAHGIFAPVDVVLGDTTPDGVEFTLQGSHLYPDLGVLTDSSDAAIVHRAAGEQCRLDTLHTDPPVEPLPDGTLNWTLQRDTSFRTSTCYNEEIVSCSMVDDSTDPPDFVPLTWSGSIEPADDGTVTSDGSLEWSTTMTCFDQDVDTQRFDVRADRKSVV